MNRINSIRNLALAVVLGAFGTVGCAGQTSDSNDSRESDLNRKSHFVGLGGTEDGNTAVVEHQLAIESSPIHVTAAEDTRGPRPEPWMEKMDLGGNQGGPRPEPWTADTNGDDGDNGGPTPPAGSSSSGGTGGSSGGNPNPAK